MSKRRKDQQGMKRKDVEQGRADKRCPIPKSGRDKAPTSEWVRAILGAKDKAAVAGKRAMKRGRQSVQKVRRHQSR